MAILRSLKLKDLTLLLADALALDAIRDLFKLSKDVCWPECVESSCFPLSRGFAFPARGNNRRKLTFYTYTVDTEIRVTAESREKEKNYDQKVRTCSEVYIHSSQSTLYRVVSPMNMHGIKHTEITQNARGKPQS